MSLQNYSGGSHELYWRLHEGSSYHWSWTVWLSGSQETELHGSRDASSRSGESDAFSMRLHDLTQKRWKPADTFLLLLTAQASEEACNWYGASPFISTTQDNHPVKQQSLLSGHKGSNPLLSPGNTRVCRSTKGEPTTKHHWEENEGRNRPVPSVWVHGAAH